MNGGNFDPIDLSCNTYYNTSPPSPGGGVQPLHIEAQLTAALGHSTVAYNTVVTPGSCNGGKDYPTGCSVNFDIACKQDSSPGTNSNTNFAAYGNYIDASGAISALTNGYACPGTTWGTPQPNVDMTTGKALPSP